MLSQQNLAQRIWSVSGYCTSERTTIVSGYCTSERTTIVSGYCTSERTTITLSELKTDFKIYSVCSYSGLVEFTDTV